MDLTQVFSSISQKVGNSKPTGETFLTVKVSSTEVAAATWSVIDGKVNLGEVSQAVVEEDGFSSLLKSADKAISQATENLEKSKVQVDRVIFGLPFHWVVEGKVVPAKLDLLRQLCKELDLKPLGYVLLSEALENYYKETEGAPLTAILLEFDGSRGLLTMYRAGKNLGSAAVKSEPEIICENLEKALKEFTQTEIFPSRIIIYDGRGELEKMAEKMTAFPWTKTLPFLHFPKVEIFESDQVVKAVAVAGGMQMGGHFEFKEVPSEQSTTFAKDEERAEAESQETENRLEELEEVSAAQAGFLPETEFKEMEIPAPYSKSETPTANLGQIKDMETPPGQSKEDFLTAIKNQASAFKPVLLTGVEKIFSIPKTLVSLLPQGADQNPGSKSKKLILIGTLIIIILLIFTGVGVYALPKVNVILKVSAPTFDKELSVTVVTDKSALSASTSAVLAGSFVNVSEIGTKKGVATGQKLVGNSAKGSVIIYSSSDGRTFPAGTILTASSGLKFNLDSSVNVASGSGAASQVTATATVTAADIGDKYNLPNGTLFTVSNFSTSSYQAKNDTAFSGGNSHQATVITKDDQTRLLATLSAELTNKAQTDLMTKLQDGQKLLPNAITSSVSTKKFSKDVGAEGEMVSLDLAMDFSGVIFSQDDLVALFSQKFFTDIPQGFALSADKTNIDIKNIKADKSGNAVLTVHLNSRLLPKVNLDDITKNIAGKSLSGATAYLITIPGVSGVTIDATPRLFQPIIKFALPWKRENIKIEIVSTN